MASLIQALKSNKRPTIKYWVLVATFFSWQIFVEKQAVDLYYDGYSRLNLKLKINLDKSNYRSLNCQWRIFCVEKIFSAMAAEP